MPTPFPRAPDQLRADWLESRRVAGELPGTQPIVRAEAERIGVGFGLDGVVARVTTWDEAGDAATLIAKWSSPEGSRREAHALRCLAERTSVPTSRLLAAFADDDAALLLLEDLAPARQGDAIEGATASEALQLAEHVARIQVAFHADLAPDALEGFRVWGADPTGQAERTAKRLPRFFELFGHLVPAGLHGPLEHLPKAILQAHERLARAPHTLLHSDLHLDNVMFRADGTPVIIDWPDAARGPGAVDVGRILVEGITVETRREIEAEMWGRYRSTLEAAGLRVDPDELARQAADVQVIMMGGVVRFREPDADSPARLVPIIENLVRNCTAALVL